MYIVRKWKEGGRELYVGETSSRERVVQFLERQPTRLGVEPWNEAKAMEK